MNEEEQLRMAQVQSMNHERQRNIFKHQLLRQTMTNERALLGQIRQMEELKPESQKQFSQ
jgi:hypothetical protein